MCQYITLSGAAPAALNSSTVSTWLSDVTVLSTHKAPISVLLLKNQPLSCCPWLFCFQMGMQGEKTSHYKSKHREALYYIHCLYRARQSNSNKKFLSSAF